MRILAIGDIHGCLKAFDAVLAAAEVTPADWIVTLGDYVDRGPNSRGVLDRIIELRKGGKLVALRGNHEEMMLDAREDLGLLSTWLQYGGQETLDSYAPADHAASFEDIPDEHWAFLEHHCVDWFESQKHFFVHANADPRRHLPDQDGMTLRWSKFDATKPHRSGKIMICGHTCQDSGWPMNVGFAICIDTCVYNGKWLTCLDVTSGKFWQANERGETREGEIADHLGGLKEPNAGRDKGNK